MNIRACKPTARCERAESESNPMINTFDLKIHSEEIFPVTEADHDEVMRLIGAESDGFEGYGEWSAALEQPSTENFVVRDGRVMHKPEPPSLGRIGGIEL